MLKVEIDYVKSKRENKGLYQPIDKSSLPFKKQYEYTLIALWHIQQNYILWGDLRVKAQLLQLQISLHLRFSAKQKLVPFP